MKRILFCLAVLLTACQQLAQVSLIPEENFTTEVDGQKVGLYTLKAGDITMQVTNFGGRVVSFWTPDKKGNQTDIVLGHDNIDAYVNYSGERFLGATVGVYANRIAGGTFTLGEQVYDLSKNEKGRTLHGGFKGVDMVVWDVDSVTDSSIVLHHIHPDGLDGYPGNVDIRMTYTLTGNNEFKVDYKATTDKLTHINLSHHSFFNLKGEGAGTILDNIMYINANGIVPVDENLIPTGEIDPVEGTPFDFRTPHAIGDMIDEDNVQLKNAGGYDHCWVLDRKTEGLELAVSVYDGTSGRFMEVFTDQPGLQFYAGNFFDGSSVGKNGKPLKFRESLALETQKYPDTPHHDNFPSTLLAPGETYTHQCVYRFSVK